MSTRQPHAGKPNALFLAKLPPELRILIYKQCLPCLRHRKNRIRSDYLPDCHWTAASRTLFRDAMPLVLRRPFLYFYTDVPSGATIASDFTVLIQRSFPNDHAWVLPEARSTLQHLAVTIKFPHYGLCCFPRAVLTYLSDLCVFSNLKDLRISTGPEVVLQRHSEDSHLSKVFDAELSLAETRIGATAEGQEEDRPTLRELFHALERALPRGCKVSWQFDTAGMPWTGFVNFGVGAAEATRTLTAFNDNLDRLWQRQISYETRIS